MGSSFGGCVSCAAKATEWEPCADPDEISNTGVCTTCVLSVSISISGTMTLVCSTEVTSCAGVEAISSLRVGVGVGSGSFSTPCQAIVMPHRGQGLVPNLMICPHLGHAKAFSVSAIFSLLSCHDKEYVSRIRR